MNPTLLLRYAAPLAAFGHTGRFDARPTATTPTMSALQGMVAAAAGIGRTVTYPTWIRDLHAAIRIDHAGTTITDYHTVNGPPARRYRWLTDKDRQKVRTLVDADGTTKKSTVVSHRGYVADATYLIALDDPTGAIETALRTPSWHLYAGRKPCPLTEPFLLGRTHHDADSALAVVPTVAHPSERSRRDNPIEPGSTTTRAAIVFRQPDTPAGHEDRNDRNVAFRRHRPQRRWHTTVTVPVATDWFAVIDHLASATEATR